MRNPPNTTQTRLQAHLTDKWRSARDLAEDAGMLSENACKGLRGLADKGEAEGRYTRDPRTNRRIVQYRRRGNGPERTFDFSGIDLADAAMLFQKILADQQS